MPIPWERKEGGREEAELFKGCPRPTEAKGPWGRVPGLRRAVEGTAEDKGWTRKQQRHRRVKKGKGGVREIEDRPLTPSGRQVIGQESH